jgi:hypothetical protein
VRSEVVPFEEPLLFPLDSRLIGAKLDLPPSAQPVGPRHRLCLLIYRFDLRPDWREVITAIEPCLTYIRPKALTYSMVPNTELEERFRAETGVDLAIVTEVGTGVPVAPFVHVVLGPHLGVKSSVAWNWQYRVLKATVVAYGQQSGFAEWEISRDGLVGPVELRAIVRVPKGGTSALSQDHRPV